MVSAPTMDSVIPKGSANDRLLPQGRLAGPMPWIVAIMIFLTVLACAAGIALGEGAAGMRDAVANRLTIQVTEADAARRDALVPRIRSAIARLPGVGRVTVAPQEELVRQLEPWLGADAAAAEIPIPALIDVDLSVEGQAGDATRAKVAEAVAAITPEARVEPHAAYIAPVAALVRTIGWIALAIVALMAVATSFVVVLAARGAHATHRGTIEVMHMLGATDGQVMRLFQRRMTRDISFGSIVGLVAAGAVILLVGRSIRLLAGDLMGSIALPWWGWVVLPILPIAFIGVAWFAARLTLQSALSRSL
ncbi:cell division protein [Sphingobium sufflavum]|uniref:cell division protein FtsX n=1 Tax=Sphingobium sufflavum TaxID=1129547 RepID=UPI001F313A70|nr:cell division protein [Sphingobium sufflavum]MCE7794959.1 cell division protein [Sphingobium sufflavum]